MKLVLDSNVIIAAFATRGLCHALFEYCLENHEVIICEKILEEVGTKLIKKIKIPRSVAREIDSYLRDSTELVLPAEVRIPKLRDENDLPILGAAAASASSYLITGDSNLLRLKKIDKTDIVSPRSFWEEMKRGGTKK
jgi:putative PIN family toxin of toxin-antitoxin system